MSPTRHPVPVTRVIPPARRTNPAITALVRRVAPPLATTAGALIASLAAERAMARLVTVALGRAGQLVAGTPFSVIAPGLARSAAPRLERTVITEITVIERISRRR